MAASCPRGSTCRHWAVCASALVPPREQAADLSARRASPAVSREREHLSERSQFTNQRSDFSDFVHVLLLLRITFLTSCLCGPRPRVHLPPGPSPWLPCCSCPMPGGRSCPPSCLTTPVGRAERASWKKPAGLCVCGGTDSPARPKRSSVTLPPRLCALALLSTGIPVTVRCGAAGVGLRGRRQGNTMPVSLQLTASASW